MKKLIAWCLFLLPSVGYCDTKISALTSTTTVSASDLIPIVGNTASTPVNRVVTFNNFTNSMTSATISNAGGLPLRLDQPTTGGSTSEGISLSQAGVQRGYLIQDNYSGQCSDLSTTCLNYAIEFGGTSASHYFFNTDGRLWVSPATMRQNAYSSVIGGSLIVGGTANYNYTDTQQIGDGNLLVNNGIIASTGTFQGAGDGKITMTIGVDTYTVTYTSVPFVVGQGLVVTSTSGAVRSATTGGTPGGTNMQIQYNNAGAFGGASNSSVTSSSITYVGTVGVSTVSVLMNGAVASANTGPGALDIYASGVVAGTHLLTVGSSSQGNSFYVPSNQMVNAGALGLVAGTVVVGDVANSWANRIYAQGDTSNFFDLRTGSTATINTGNANGFGDIRMQPNSVLALTVSNQIASGVIASSMTVQGYFQYPIRTKAQIGLITPTVTTGNGLATGEAYYCSDCATVAVCVSTGTAQGAFALITNKGSQCL